MCEISQWQRRASRLPHSTRRWSFYRCYLLWGGGELPPGVKGRRRRVLTTFTGYILTPPPPPAQPQKKKKKQQNPLVNTEPRSVPHHPSWTAARFCISCCCSWKKTRLSDLVAGEPGGGGERSRARAQADTLHIKGNLACSLVQGFLPAWTFSLSDDSCKVVSSGSHFLISFIFFPRLLNVALRGGEMLAWQKPT